MAKTNYTKVEEALTEGLRKIEVDKLLEIADQNAGKPQAHPLRTKPKVNPIHRKRLMLINQELLSLEKIGKDPYRRLNIDQQEIKKFLADPASLNLENWARVKKIKEQIAIYKLELEKKDGDSSNETLVNEQRKSHITKRFNINKKWLPLQ